MLGVGSDTSFTAFFSDLGLAMLFFFAGHELDLGRMRGEPLRLGALGWALSLALAGSALATTAIGTLIPVLSDAGELRTRFGTYLLAAGAVG